MPEETSTTETDTETETDPDKGTGGTGTPPAEPTPDEIAALCTELKITPGQLKGRLEASRKWENRAKENQTAARELEKLRRDGMDDLEKARAEGRDEGKKEASSAAAQKLAAAEIRAALTGVAGDPASIVEDLDLAKFVTDDDEVDTDKVTKLREKYAGMTGGKNPADLRQGARGSGSEKKAGDVNQMIRDRMQGNR